MKHKTGFLNLLLALFTALAFALAGQATAQTKTRAAKLNGVWELQRIKGAKLRARKNVTLQILDGNRYSLYAGCNTMNGPVAFKRRQIRFQPGMSTRKGCPDNYENRFSNLVFKSRRYELARGKSKRHRLLLKAGRMTLVFVRRGNPLQQGSNPKPGLDGQTWRVNSVNLDGGMVSSIYQPEQSLRFSKGGIASGQAGCGNFSANYILKGDNLRFTNIRPGRHTVNCTDQARRFHNAFFAALPRVRKLSHMGGNHYWLRNAKGSGLIGIRQD